MSHIHLSCSNLIRSVNRLLSQRISTGRFSVAYQSNQTDIKQDFNGPALRDFIQANSAPYVVTNRSPEPPLTPYISENDLNGNGRKVYIEVFGCQMNVNDTQLVQTILHERGYEILKEPQDMVESDIHLIMTCSIREGAEQKIWNRLKQLRNQRRKQSGERRQFGILGCMAERLKTKILEKELLVDIVCGPDAYRDLPKMLAVNNISGQSAVNVLLSMDETYSDILPVNETTLNPDKKTAFISIMRGCDNFCSFCIVPFTRGRERSRPISSIEDEVRKLSDMGVREVTLLGQNVNSFRDRSIEFSESTVGLSAGFKTIYKSKRGGVTFDGLLDRVAQIDPNMRVRFTSPHPKDFPDEFLDVIKSHHNVCNSIHLPAQSGSNAVLDRMRRGYTRESFLNLVDRIRSKIPNIFLSTDIIAGFCGETEEDHKKTIDLLEQVKFNFVYAFPYSMREKTHAYHKFEDNVPEEAKKQRHIEIHSTFRLIASRLNEQMIGSTQLVLIEGKSKKSNDQLYGKCDGNIKVIIPNVPVAHLHNTGDATRTEDSYEEQCRLLEPGRYVTVAINGSTSQTLFGTPLFECGLQDFTKFDSILFNRHTVQ